MKKHKNLAKFVEFWKEELYVRLSRPNSMIQPSLLGLVIGLLSGALVILFRYLIEVAQGAMLPDGSFENYEALSIYARFLLPVVTAGFIATALWFFAKGRYSLGMLNVLEQVNYHQSKFKLRGMLLQFATGAMAIIGGFSVGREGPGVALGSSTGSLIGQYLHVPNNTLRTLVGCGSAAAISASFNTPLAGVIFAMEVVMLEYTLASVIPVILASVSATAFGFLVFGDISAFAIPETRVSTLGELPLIVALGVMAGIVSTFFIRAVAVTAERAKSLHFAVRLGLAGVAMGIFAVAVPEVMSIGYDTVNHVILGGLGAATLTLILILKLVATSASVGLGVPAGFIGPVMFMGAMLGGIVTHLQVFFFPELDSQTGLLAVIGMGAMMAATLQAPLAALIALLELTSNTGIIFPGMLAIVCAELTRSEVFHQPSIFKTLMKIKGMDYGANPLSLHLQRIGVFSAMQRNFSQLDATVERAAAAATLKKEPRWIVITPLDGKRQLMPAAELARYLQENDQDEVFDLTQIPARRLEMAGIHRGATLQEAKTLIEQKHLGAVFVYDTPAPNIKRLRGILLPSDIEEAYLY